MKILLACLSYREYSGSEIYFYELSSALRDMGHEVFIFSPHLGSPLQDRTTNISFLNKETINNKKFDLLIFSHGKIIWNYLKNVHVDKTINVIHSEVLDLEEPVIDKQVDVYVGIRPSIIDYIKTYISDKPIKLIYNPFNFNRFNIKNCKKEVTEREKTVLFPGSLDYLRVQPLKYLLKLSEEQNFKVIHVGRNDFNIKHPNFTTHLGVWDIEKFYRKCDIVSGIFLGRTSIEGLLCGKRVLQFDVDNKGNIKKVYWHTEDNLDKFDKNKVALEFIYEI